MVLKVLLANALFAQEPVFERRHLILGQLAGLLDYEVGRGNGDALPDLLICQNTSFQYPGNAGVHLLLQEPDGTFSTGAAFAPELGMPVRLKQGDVDGDGNPELLATYQSPTYRQDLWIFRGLAGGGFGSGIQLLDEAPCLQDMALVDLDEDMDLDVITLSPFLMLHRNLGSFSFGAPETLATVTGNSFRLADFDGDWDLDVVLRLPSTLDYVRNEGGVFTAAGSLSLPNSGKHELEVLDVENDGLPDLVTSAQDGAYLLPNAGGASPFTTSLHLAGQNTEPEALLVLDEDGDEDLDILFADPTGNRFGIWRATGGPAPNFGTATTLHTMAKAYGLSLADMDGDGRRDLLLRGDPGGRLDVRAGLAQGGFDTPVNRCGGGSIWWDQFCFADMDQDGAVDLVAPAGFGTTIYSLDIFRGGNQGRTFSLEQQLVGTNLGASLAATGDFNGDGLLDIAGYTSSNETVKWMRNLGNWQFSNGTSVGTAPSPSDIHAADMDADGLTDLVVSVPFSNTYYLEQATASGFQDCHQDGLVSNIRRTRSGDFDQDGDLDLLTYSWTANPSMRWRVNEGFPCSMTSSHAVGGLFTTARGIQVIDVDANQSPDVLYFQQTGGGALLRNLGGDGSQFSSHSFGPALEAMRFFDGQDMDGDGDVDLLGWDDAGQSMEWVENAGGEGPLWVRHSLGRPASGISYMKGLDMDGDGDMDVLHSSEDSGQVEWLENEAFSRVGDAAPLLPRTQAVVAAVPNPFNSRTRLSLTASFASPPRFQVFDLQGRLLSDQSGQRLDATSWTADVNAAAWPSGLYVVRAGGPGAWHGGKLVHCK